MKKLLILFSIFLSLTSCNQKSKVQSENSEMKVPTAAEIRKKEIQDSIERVKTDSLAQFAWGDAKFGISMKKTLATEAFKGGDKYDDMISMKLDRLNMFSNAIGVNVLSDILAQFKENELYRICAESYYLRANEISTLTEDCDIFINNFTEKYGNPFYKKEKVNISDFSSGEEFVYAKYEIGSKSITIALGERDLDILFYYKIYIDNEEFPKKKHVMTDKEIQEVRKQMEEAEKIKNNSF